MQDDKKIGPRDAPLNDVRSVNWQGATSDISDARSVFLSSVPYNCLDEFRTTEASALYTHEERRRRDETRWTLVQGILAPVQFLVFFVSLVLVLRYFATGEGFAEASVSVVVKTLALYAIMITGAIWEKVVFGQYLFARAFFWEDVFSILVLALHTTYLVLLFGGLASPREQLLVALAAYAAYVINATQFLMKLRAARRDVSPSRLRLEAAE